MWRVETWYGTKERGSWRLISREDDTEKVWAAVQKLGKQRVVRARNPKAKVGDYHLMWANPSASYRQRLVPAEAEAPKKPDE